ncbi:non-ribosomal peptide synthetase adenylation domain protein [Streptomyces sp. WAC07149]|uniref:amino acid adenylation domain-containing protein n=1 Tax=Streptomyces sp. WAC07149 TaxID=2487425 RepID=UPI000F772F8A|nr:amino acid adenylation domain-containing protein [Streptomyces sp. WAC07149]RST08714.1 non-ribosomal peptide synthetase adenylation domain protein [Streptomyces sp. WAC07149]
MSQTEAAEAARLALTRPLALDLTTTLVGHLARHAAATPDTVFIHHGPRTTTYGRLLEQVAQVRGELLAAGCRPGDVVACAGPRSARTLALFLALESIGAVYLPLGPDWPAQRTASVLRRSAADLVADYLGEDAADARHALEEAAGAAGTRVLTLGTDPAHDTHETHEAAAQPRWRTHCAGGEPRYVFYTSGTTGVPKGALIEHQGMVNHLWAKIIDLGLGDTDVIAFSAPLTFDIAIWQMLVPLMTGSSLAILDDGHMSFPRRLAGELRARRVTVLELVPTTLGWLADEVLRSGSPLDDLRWVVSTGEELHPALARRFFRALPHCSLGNAWGFTECSDDLTHHTVRTSELDQERLPVGPPIVNVTLYVLVRDEATGQWKAARPGEPGEIFAGGVPVGRGYLADDEATGRAYFRDVIDPRSPTGRLYKGGDAGYVKDGLLHYLGRLDRQVKVAGVRMELDEIETVLKSHPHVAQGTVLAVGDGHDRQLVACYTPAPDGCDERDLQRHLRRALPAPMVPSRWLALPEMPLNGNGKTDHKALTRMIGEQR